MPNLDRISPAKDKSIKKIVSVMTGAGLYVDALCILHKSNYLKINEICLRAWDDGIRELFFMNLFSSTEGVQTNCLNLARIQEAFDLIAQAKETITGIEIDCLGNFGPTSWKPSHLRLAVMNKYCPAGVDSVYVAVDASVYPNHCMLREDLKMGAFEDGQFVLSHNPLAGFDRSDCAVVCGHLS